MRLYIGIARTALALLLAATLLIGVATAIPLPTGPPEVDSTPVSHEEEPEGFREEASLPQEIPEPLPQPTEGPLRPINKTPPEVDDYSHTAGIDTSSILLIGAAIWYVVTLIGVSGGRHGRRRRKGNPNE